jgi:hypothetical protein
MKASEFCYWLQGFFELRAASSPVKAIDGNQAAMIERHLAMVFVHDLDPQQVADKLQEAHDGKKPPAFGGTGPNGEIMRC